MLSVELLKNIDLSFLSDNAKALTEKAVRHIIDNELSVFNFDQNNRTTFFEWGCQCCGKKEYVSSNVLMKKSKVCVNCWREGETERAKNEILEKLKDLDIKVKSVTKDKLKKSIWTMVCPHGHVFKKTGHRISKNFFTQNTMTCPICWKPSLEEERVRALIESHFQKKFKTIHPNWLINPDTNCPMELDMYCKELKIAVEYNGIHHYEPIYGEERLIETQNKDLLKKQMCEQLGVKFITIKCNTKSNTISVKIKDWVEQFKEYGIDISQEAIEFAQEQKLTREKPELEDAIHNKLKNVGMSWKDGVYTNKTSVLTISFNKCGHSLKKEVRHIRKLKENERFTCSICSRVEMQESAAKIMCAQNGWVFKKLSYKKNTSMVKGFIAIEKGKEIAVSDYSFTKFKNENNLNVR